MIARTIDISDISESKRNTCLLCPNTLAIFISCADLYASPSLSHECFLQCLLLVCSENVTSPCQQLCRASSLEAIDTCGNSGSNFVRDLSEKREEILHTVSFMYRGVIMSCLTVDGIDDAWMNWSSAIA